MRWELRSHYPMLLMPPSSPPTCSHLALESPALLVSPHCRYTLPISSSPHSWPHCYHLSSWLRHAARRSFTSAAMPLPTSLSHSQLKKLPIRFAWTIVSPRASVRSWSSSYLAVLPNASAPSWASLPTRYVRTWATSTRSCPFPLATIWPTFLIQQCILRPANYLLNS